MVFYHIIHKIEKRTKLNMKKKVWVFGVGLFGGFLVENLINVKNIDVELIDKNSEKLRRFRNWKVPLHVIDTESYEELKELEIKPNDICVVAIGDNLGSSILTCQNLIDFGNRRIYVRVLNERHRKIMNSMQIYETIEVHSFAGVRLAAKIANDLELFMLDKDNEYTVIKVKNIKLTNITLEATNIRKSSQSNVLLIKRKGNSIIPKGNTKIKMNDLIYIFLPKNQQNQVIRIFGHQLNEV